MRKVFTTILPDEPYKTSTALNKTIECTYDGPRYLLLRIRKEDGYVFCIDRVSEDLADLESHKIEQSRLDPEGVYQIVLDAQVHTWEAAYMTGDYTHAPFDDHVETLPNGETWTYHYDDEACAVEQPFYVNDMFYEQTTSTYKRPRYRVHAVAKRDFWAGIATQIATYQSMVDDGSYAEKGYDADQMEAIREHLTWLKTCEATYAGVDHWKIKFPSLAISSKTVKS